MQSQTDIQIGQGEIIKSLYLARAERNHRYSLRAFSRDLGISHSHLSRVIRGEKFLSLQQAYFIAEQLKLPPNALQALVASVREARADRGANRRKAKIQIGFTLDVELFRLMSSWYHGAILELIANQDFQSDVKWIAKRLSVSSRDISSALKRLERLGLIKSKNGIWSNVHANIAIPTHVSLPALRAYHREMILKASEELSENNISDFENRDITGTTLSFSKRLLPTVKKRIYLFRQEINKLAQKEQGTDVYQLNVQFFPLTKPKTRVQRKSK